MLKRVVVGLFESKGEAENAGHRLVSEGIPKGDISVKMLRRTGPVPKTMEPELETLSLDPFFWFLGDLKEDYAGYITNGETAVVVEVPNDGQAAAARSILEMFEPERVDILTPAFHDRA